VDHPQWGNVDPQLSSLSLSQSLVETLLEGLAVPEPTSTRSGRRAGRPFHVLYGGAHLFDRRSPSKLGDLARAAMTKWGADDEAFGRAIGVDDAALAKTVATRVRARLETRPLEAMCIDFEDGYGPRSDADEDADAVRTAQELVELRRGRAADDVEIGVRIKPLTSPGRGTSRAVRTLDLFATALAKAAGSEAPTFTLTLPKVARPEEVHVLVDVLDRLESLLGLPRVDVELMIETPGALFAADGRLALPPLLEAGRGRVRTVHLGAYDLTSELGITAADQRLDHPICDLARALLKIATADTGVEVADGATTLLPLAPREADASDPRAVATIHHAWAVHARHVRAAIDVGIWQGWDLHPAQLPARYGALHAHFASRKNALTARLRSFVENAARASRVGQAFDDAATGHGLLHFFRRGLACGALDEADLAATKLTREELEHGRFAEIVARSS
jgi:hypothetical protein